MMTFVTFSDFATSCSLDTNWHGWWTVYRVHSDALTTLRMSPQLCRNYSFHDDFCNVFGLRDQLLTWYELTWMVWHVSWVLWMMVVVFHPLWLEVDDVTAYVLKMLTTWMVWHVSWVLWMMVDVFHPLWLEVDDVALHDMRSVKIN